MKRTGSMNVPRSLMVPDPGKGGYNFFPSGCMYRGSPGWVTLITGVYGRNDTNSNPGFIACNFSLIFIIMAKYLYN
jgi:hypothetical protein